MLDYDKNFLLKSWDNFIGSEARAASSALVR
jgi:hypothetical protein